MVNKATEIRLLAEKQMGEFLATSPKNEGAATRSSASTALPPTLAEIGISKDQSARAQKLAALTDEEFQFRIDAVCLYACVIRSASVAFSHETRHGLDPSLTLGM